MSWSEESRARTGQRVVGHNAADPDTRFPTGGWASDGRHIDHAGNNMPGLLIRWQDGPVDRSIGQKPNGTFVEDVLQAAKNRLEFYQGSPMACEENAAAIQHIEEAICAMESRRDRMKQPTAASHRKS